MTGLQMSCEIHPKFSFFLCRSLERSPFEVGKHVLRREMTSKFTLAMIEAIFLLYIYKCRN